MSRDTVHDSDVVDYFNSSQELQQNFDRNFSMPVGSNLPQPLQSLDQMPLDYPISPISSPCPVTPTSTTREPRVIRAAPDPEAEKEARRQAKRDEQRKKRNESAKKKREEGLRHFQVPEGEVIPAPAINPRDADACFTMKLNELNANFKMDLVNGVLTCFDNIVPYIPNTTNCKTVDEYMAAEKKLVEYMNQWFGEIRGGGADIKYVMRIPRENRYDFQFMRKEGFRALFLNYRFLGIKRDDYLKAHYAVHSPEAPLQPQLPRKKNAEGEWEIQVIPSPDVLNLGDVWLSSPYKRIYDNLVFNPRPDTFMNAAKGNVLNTWSGFAYSRKECQYFQEWALIKMILNHIRFTWADTDQQFEYILKKIALIFQKPWLKQQVGILLAGIEGSGKTVLFDKLLGPLIGESHFVSIQSASEITGEFNSILAHKVLAFFDEAMTGGKKEMNTLKNLHTGDKQRMRKMFQDTEMIDSYLNIFYATNDLDKIMEINGKSRRISMFYSNPRPLLEHPDYIHFFQRNLTKYFKQLIKDCKDETVRKTFANFLYNLPIGDFDFNVKIDTALFARQASQNLPLIERWWQNCLSSSEPYNIQISTDVATRSWYNQFNISLAYKCFDYWCAGVKEKNIHPTAMSFYNDFGHLLPASCIRTPKGSSDYEITFPTMNTAQNIEACWNHFFVKNPELKLIQNNPSLDELKHHRIQEVMDNSILGNSTAYYLPEFGGIRKRKGLKIKMDYRDEDDEKDPSLENELATRQEEIRNYEPVQNFKE